MRNDIRMNSQYCSLLKERRWANCEREKRRKNTTNFCIFKTKKLKRKRNKNTGRRRVCFSCASWPSDLLRLNEWNGFVMAFWWWFSFDTRACVYVSLSLPLCAPLSISLNLKWWCLADTNWRLTTHLELSAHSVVMYTYSLHTHAQHVSMSTNNWF